MWRVGIHDPEAPTLVGEVAVPGRIMGVHVSGGIAYLGGYLSGLLVADVSVPAMPFLVGSVDTPGQAHGVWADGNLVYVAEGGLWIFAPQCTSAAVGPRETQALLRLLDPYPNPFNPAVTISFEMPQSASVELAIFDLAGRRIDTLFAGELAAGVHFFDWRAPDLASGTYFCRVVGGGQTVTRPVTLLK